ncbi:hypothetical protein [Streptomyces canus]|uniref:hypothetical protein n=1 Tax=Streptomyces canus TaxID=58343 RepID=UPI00386F6293|nr:hypothetical protein OH824_17645 [Streptomyces canus]
MEQATQATTPTASTETTALADPRAAYKRVADIAQRIIDRLTTVMPNAVEVYREAGAYGIRLHFGLGHTAGRGVLEVAHIADVEATRDSTMVGTEAWIECRAVVEGVHLVARALVTQEDADQLMQRTTAPPAPDEADTPPAADQQPVPLGASVLAQVPAITPIEAIGGGQ